MCNWTLYIDYPLFFIASLILFTAITYAAVLRSILYFCAVEYTSLNAFIIFSSSLLLTSSNVQ